MNTPMRILVVAETLGEAGEVKQLLAGEFDDITLASAADPVVAGFCACKPALLILAFRELPRAEDYFHTLCRFRTTLNAPCPQTLIFCTEQTVTRAYALCREEYFDDYVLYWPTPEDRLRLPMAVHGAVRRCCADSAAGSARHWPSTAEQEELSGPESAPLTPDEPAADAPVVLVADDDAFQHKLLRRILRDAPLQLVFATSGSQALAMMKARCPDLVLMDVNMPDIEGINGIETTRRIKAIRSCADVPVIMITGLSAKGVVAESLQAGAADFLVKPFDKAAVRGKIKKYLDKSAARRCG